VITPHLVTAARRFDTPVFVYDLDGIEEMLASYFATDLWPFLERTTQPVHLVRAVRSSVWTPEETARLAALPESGSVRAHAIDAGHWLQVDAPDVLLDLVAPP
jgi:pimeloyl-ACP methyl ester carboxylesterase